MLLMALLIAIPLAGALVAWLLPSNHGRPWILPVAATLHLILVIGLCIQSPPPSAEGWFNLDAIGKIFLLEIAALFTACAFYAVNYLQYRKERNNRVLCIGMLVCQAAMSLAMITHHLGLLWLAIETTTLCMAPLVYFNRNARSIEATWKFMLICSIGIALALLGIFFLAYAAVVAGLEPSLVLETLQGYARRLPPVWLHAAFVFMLVGYGTKMGLAPMHTWKPDAYGEAPGLVGAMLAGGLANCGFLGLIRIYQVCQASGDIAFYSFSMISIGMFSIAVAAIFLLRQTDFKRMLAYSSVEHMGLLVVALGIGGKAVYGAILHVLGNGLAKGVLFLAAGNIHRAFGSKNRDVACGALKRAPWSAGLFLVSFFALTGSPPFLPFFSEITIFTAAFANDRPIVGTVVVLMVMTIFVGMALTVLPVVFGDPPKNRQRTKYHDAPLLIIPPAILLAIMALLGIWLPEPLSRILTDAAALLGVAQ